jgi:hypothetical protein
MMENTMVGIGSASERVNQFDLVIQFNLVFQSFILKSCSCNAIARVRISALSHSLSISNGADNSQSLKCFFNRSEIDVKHVKD